MRRVGGFGAFFPWLFNTNMGPAVAVHLLDVSLGADVVVLAGATDTIVYDTVNEDDLGDYSTTTGVFTPSVPGFWYFSAQLFGTSFTFSAAYDLAMRFNGAGKFFTRLTAAGGSGTLALVGLVNFNGTTDNIDMRITNNAVGNMSLLGSSPIFSHLFGIFLGMP